MSNTTEEYLIRRVQELELELKEAKSPDVTFVAVSFVFGVVSGILMFVVTCGYVLM